MCWGERLFTKTKDILPKLIAWDSISAREGGLPDLVELMASPRGHTTAGPIDVPYRHGILHGRDLGYGNRLVAAKAWAALFSLRDWAIKYERGETQRPPVEPPPSLRDSLITLADVERQRREILAWKPRSEIELPKEGGEPRSDTPESAALRWLSAWQARDFRGMAAWTQVSRQAQDAQLAANLESMFGVRDLASYRIVAIRDVAAALTEIKAELQFDGSGPPVLMTANVILEDEEGKPLVRGTAPGTWGVNEISALRQSPTA